MQQYKGLIWDILDHGEDRSDRTGVGTRSLFGEQIRFDLRHTFPIVTLKYTFWRAIVQELLWFLHPTQDLWYLHSHNIHIWDAWARSGGVVGPIYGNQWRHWRVKQREQEKLNYGSYDQLSVVINQIKRHPDSRRHLISAWNVEDLDLMALVPCHVMYQFYVSRSNELSCHMYQRSADAFIGLPFNIASYALLTHMVAQVCRLKVGDLIISFGDVHLYQNHLDLARTMLERDPLRGPTLTLDPSIMDIDEFTAGHIRLNDYQYHPAIKAEIAV